MSSTEIGAQISPNSIEQTFFEEQHPSANVYKFALSFAFRLYSIHLPLLFFPYSKTLHNSSYFIIQLREPRGQPLECLILGEWAIFVINLKWDCTGRTDKKYFMQAVIFNLRIWNHYIYFDVRPNGKWILILPEFKEVL